MMQTFHVNPTTALSSGIAIVAIFAWLYGFYRVYSSYKNTGKRQSLYFSIGLLFGAFAIILLASELISLQLFDAGTQAGQEYVGSAIGFGINSYNAGFVFAYLAILTSAFAILMFDAFSLSFFENKMKFLVIPAILLIAYVVVYLYPDWPKIMLNSSGTDYNPTHTGAIDAALVAIFLLPLFFPAIVFFFSALQSRGNGFMVKRSLALSFFQILIGVGYTIEIVGGIDYLSVIGRLFILLYPWLTWNTIQSNGWLSKLLGAPR